MNLKFYVKTDDFESTARIYGWVERQRNSNVEIVKPCEITTEQVDVRTATHHHQPMLTISNQEARELYEALGRHLGVVPALQADAVLKAKDEHIRDLNRIIENLVKQ